MSSNKKRETGGSTKSGRQEKIWKNDERGLTVSSATPENIQVLLKAGADPKAKDLHGKTPWDLAKRNDALKDTKSYWALNDAQYR